MPNETAAQAAATARVTQALEAAGLFPAQLTDTILNVHTEPVTPDGSGDDLSYLATITVTITA